MKKLAAGWVLFVVAVTLAAAASGAPPYDVTATFDPPVVTATEGPADGFRLYQGCRAGESKALVGEVTSGQTFTGLLTADGTYSFCVHAYNATGEGPSSPVAVVTINDFDPAPGVPVNFNITVTCDASCTVNITMEPAP